MSSEYAALANDFYVNQRINLKMDLPMKRDTVLSLFDRVRREVPGMDRFRRYDNELALESRGESVAPGGAAGQQWLAVRRTSVRSGSVNPGTVRDGYALHRLVLETAPYFLDISPLDVDHIELLYGFDMLASGNHDSIVFHALMGGSPLAALVEGVSGDAHGGEGARVPLDCQPLLGVALNDDGHLQAHFEIKTRTNARHGRHGEGREEPISLYLVVRRHGPFADLRQFPRVLKELVDKGEDLLDSCVVPRLLGPVRDAIASGQG